jgi:hypothetical protein
VSDALNIRSGHRSPFNLVVFRQNGPAHRRAEKALPMNQRKVMSEKQHLTSF